LLRKDKKKIRSKRRKNLLLLSKVLLLHNHRHQRRKKADFSSDSSKRYSDQVRLKLRTPRLTEEEINALTEDVVAETTNGMIEEGTEMIRAIVDGRDAAAAETKSAEQTQPPGISHNTRMRLKTLREHLLNQGPKIKHQPVLMPITEERAKTVVDVVEQMTDEDVTDEMIEMRMPKFGTPLAMNL
jgi:hypothetical protein